MNVITVGDIQKVATDLNFILSVEDAIKVVNLYKKEQSSDIWTAVVEDILYREFADKQQQKFLTNQQVKDLKAKEWTQLQPMGTKVVMYAEDYRNDSWKEYCDLLNIEATATEITLFVVATK